MNTSSISVLPKKISSEQVNVPVIRAGYGKITLELDGVDERDVERCRGILHSLVEWGILTIKNSKVTLHFGSTGDLDIMERVVIHRRRPPS